MEPLEEEKLSSNCGCVWLGKAGKDPRFVKALSWKALLVVEQHRQRWRGRTTDEGGGKQPAVLLVANTVCCSGRLLLCLAHASGDKDFFLSIVPVYSTSKLPCSVLQETFLDFSDGDSSPTAGLQHLTTMEMPNSCDLLVHMCPYTHTQTH